MLEYPREPFLRNRTTEMSVHRLWALWLNKIKALNFVFFFFANLGINTWADFFHDHTTVLFLVWLSLQWLPQICIAVNWIMKRRSLVRREETAVLRDVCVELWATHGAFYLAVQPGRMAFSWHTVLVAGHLACGPGIFGLLCIAESPHPPNSHLYLSLTLSPSPCSLWPLA